MAKKSGEVNVSKSKTINILMSEIDLKLQSLDSAVMQKSQRISQAREGVIKYVSEIKSILKK